MYNADVTKDALISASPINFNHLPVPPGAGGLRREVGRISFRDLRNTMRLD